MSRKLTSTVFVVFLVLAITTLTGAESKRLPRPLDSRPGNVFIEGDNVVVQLPDSRDNWRLLNYEDRVIAPVRAVDRKANLGKLSVGFYRLSCAGDSNWVSLAVLKPLKAPTPQDSPICLDVAMAWFYPQEKMDAVANLCALAGVNWVRDRLNWAQMEPERGKFATENQYDHSALAQSAAGLKVLQVNHISPKWANPDTKRFPLDLRDAYKFYRQMAKRWQGKVLAFEPWNEADIPAFGGHTGAEMASYQKAAYLGLKSGNPKIIACLNVLAHHNQPHLDDLFNNETYSYFDTYNFHHYEPFENYPLIYNKHRAVSGGKPLWVTEAALPVRWSGSPDLKELADPELKTQSERLVKTFAHSIFEGSVATFYFLLPHYVEGKTQFGILRPDITPRPAYVSLAACGRILAGAKPIGKINTQDPDIQGFMFAAKPDGVPQNILVIWHNKKSTSITLPVSPVAVYDHLGRELEMNKSDSKSILISTAPLFLVFKPEISKRFNLIKPPAPQPVIKSEVSPIVIQSIMPVEKVDLKNSSYKVSPKNNTILPLYFYNFSVKEQSIKTIVAAPTGWTTVIIPEVKLQPMERKQVNLTISPPTSWSDKMALIKIIATGSKVPQSVLSLRLTAE